MPATYSHLYNAVILPVTSIDEAGGQRFQVSASRNDHETARYLSPAWLEADLHMAFLGAGLSKPEFQELLRGNRRATGGRNARRLLFTATQLEAMGLTQEPLQKPALGAQAGGSI